MVRRIFHVARGAQRGADLPLPEGTTCIIGSAPGKCGVVLGDKGVAPRHCMLTQDARGHYMCTALDAAVWVGQRELPPGASMAMPDFLPLRCGQATLIFGPEGSDWSYSMVAAESAPGLAQRSSAGLQRVRAASPAAFAGLLLCSLLLVGGSVWGAVSWLTSPQRLPGDQLARSQRWLVATAPQGSELQLIVDESMQQLVVSGYVPTERAREALLSAIARQPQPLRAEVVSVESMLSALSRTAAREGLACDAAYRGGGRTACVNALADAAAAERMRTASLQVPGVRELSLQAASPPAPATAGRKFAVLMSNLRGSQLIGPAGERWHEGDLFEGMTIRRILFDQVVFDRGAEEVVLHLPRLR